MWFDLRFDNMRSHRDWCITRAVLCRPCRYHRSQSSYDDSSWRQTAFSQSVALMSPLCPSVQREGWLSLVCVGDHSTIRAKPFCHSSPCVWKVCQRGQYINTEINAVRLLCKLRFYRRDPCLSVRVLRGEMFRSTVCSIQDVCVNSMLSIWSVQFLTCRRQSIFESSLFQLQISRYFKLSKFRAQLCRLLIYTCKI